MGGRTIAYCHGRCASCEEGSPHIITALVRVVSVKDYFVSRAFPVFRNYYSCGKREFFQGVKKKFAARTMNVLSVPNWTVNFSSFHIDISLRKERERERVVLKGETDEWNYKTGHGRFHCMICGKSSPFPFLDQWWYHLGKF